MQGVSVQSGQTIRLPTKGAIQKIMMFGLLVAVCVLGLFSGITDAIFYKNIQCDSNNFQDNSCTLGLTCPYSIIDVTVVKRDSNSACVFGSSFGISDSGTSIFVNNGCRALFNVKACNNVAAVSCDSWKYAYATCTVPGGNYVNYVEVQSKRSRSACTEYSSFGATGDQIWVNKGCRATFLVCTDLPYVHDIHDCVALTS